MPEERSITQDFPFVTSQTQVQRICRHLIAFSELGRTMKHNEDVTAFRLRPGQVVRKYHADDLSELNGLYKIVRRGDTDRDDEFALELREYDGEKLYGFNPSVDERDWQAEAA